MKRYLMTIALGALALYLVACGSRPAPTPSAQGSAAPSGPAAAAAPTAGDPQAGQALYGQTCTACHGADAKGLKGLGKDLVASTFCKEKTDAELLEFIKKGRDPSDPANTTGVAMPPKGGNPALTDQQIMDIIAYIRELQKKG